MASDRIRVAMAPHPDAIDKNASSGIAQVVLNWARHLPAHGIEIVPDGHPAQVTIGHVTANVNADIHVSHGLLWTEEFDLGGYAYEVNRDLVTAARQAKEIVTPSEWVADVYRRDMHRSPHVIRHGVNVEEWTPRESQGYVLYTKNRQSDGLNPSAINAIAREMPSVTFMTTFATRDSPPNVRTLGGAVPHSEMRRHIENAGVVLFTDRETWCIAAAEALAAGVPVVSTDAGAVKEFLHHGETGYLYKNQGLLDAIQGINYCLEHRDVLGQNARKYAEEHLTWDAPIERLVEVIRRVAADNTMVQEPSVSVVITSHNFGDSVPEAIASVMNQTYDRVTGVYVIDDSSDEGDKTFEATQVYDGNPGPVVVYERVEYGNVAMARNRGIAMSGGKYVVSLDGDDWLREEWVADCVALLEEDATAGFAYGGSEVHILKDGKVQQVLVPPELSEEMGLPAHKPWPTEEHDKQFTVGKANQYPSGIMFRREALGLAGGYRPRYSPKGAGTEDAQLTLRLLSLGWTGRMTRPTHSNLWVHTHGQGHVSGDKEFKEVDWRAWLPWTQDYRFPFAAAATPKHLSHQVRSYEPDVSVIIPVGPGHETALINALDSLDAQQYRNWEAIVVFDGAHPQLPGMPPGDRGSSNGYWPDETAALRFIHAYPHVRVLTMSQTSSGASGPGAARNLGVQHARADYVTFLDADDYMSPQFLAQVNPQVSRTENAIVYGRYLSRMTRKQHEQFGGTVVRDEGDTLVVDFAFRPFDRAKAMARPEGERPYVWSGVNILLPKAWHEAIGGFDEDLESWEDCLYLLRLAWEGYSFHLVDQPLWVYSFVDGRRRRASHGSESELMAIFQEKYETAMASQYERV